LVRVQPGELLDALTGATALASRLVTSAAGPFDELLRRLGAISDVQRSLALLAWDEETKMPPAGAAARAEQQGTLARIAHELATTPELGELLETLRDFEAQHEPESFEASVIRVTRRDYEKDRRVPAELRAELTRAGSLGYRAWLEAREACDYAVFQPHLERLLELTHEYIACQAPFDDPYDVVLDDYEPGMKTAEVQAVFDRLRDGLVALVGDLGEPVDDSCLYGDYPVDLQRAFSLELLGRWGMDDDAWRLDDTVHPFAVSLAHNDIRLTTRLFPDNVGGLLSCLHEFGHGIYERQVDPRYFRTSLASGVSSAFHESQSRLWENVVGRALSTWRFFYPRLQETFPERLAGVSLEEFHRALNKVAPSTRRVEADEVTYSLHIILRFELEREMLAGTVTPADLPEAFDAKLRDYLGVEPVDVVDGVLQDVHWSGPSFGYFPTYALGNVISIQLFERAVAELGDLDAQFERGEFGPLREWLGEHVHRWGRTFEPPELLQRTVGGPLDAEPYLRYLRGKVDALYAGEALPS
jgi:carboxypeptidase Taq